MAGWKIDRLDTPTDGDPATMNPRRETFDQLVAARCETLPV